MQETANDLSVYSVYVDNTDSSHILVYKPNAQRAC